MNKRSIEEYIKENKKEFDFKTPSDQLWARIEAGLDKEKVKKKSGMPFWLGIAASLILIMTVTFMYTSRKGGKQELEIADISPVYGKKEMKFASLIEEKKDSLQVFAKKNPVLYKKFSSDLNQLDGDYEKLKKELQHSPNQEIVVRAMVKNLELQLQVINQQLSIINEVNQYKEENQI